ncbi:hypothetical protein [Halobacteriovorax sp. HLS]|uniref:hypothetical protein n=1 Tax=Halobacteriovorax sp. HLS TaxID=2234000 RepID=UPI000FDC91A4|nr:hypothetical protein [Halobacteriovorax sp. HLS]
MTKISYTLWPFIFAILCATSFAKTVEQDNEYISRLISECENNKKFLIGNDYKVECLRTHQHYNSESTDRYSESAATSQGKVRIAGYNLWHPGSQNSIHKDYKLLAKIINEFDVTSVIELLPLVNIDYKNNEAVTDYLAETPEKIRKLKIELKKAVSEGNSSLIRELNSEISTFEKGLDQAPSLYRSPGYLKLLTELRKLDSTWSLILSPRGDSAKVQNVKELTGFLYRGKTVKPITNDHCLETYKKEKGKKIACFPNLHASFMGRETSHVFSRRPLLASFKSGKFDFSLLTSHVVFTSPHPVEKKDEMEAILKPSFGVLHYENLGTGLDGQNYARFAEAKIILELMEKLGRNYKEKDIMYIGDMNLTADNPYWSDLLKEHSSPNLLIEEATSLSLALYNSSGERTNSMASNYDHFITPKGRFDNCLKRNGEFDARRIDYSSGFIRDYIYDNYIVRSKRLKLSTEETGIIEDELPDDTIEESIVNDYALTRDGTKRMNFMIRNMAKELNSIYTIKRDQIVKDDSRIDRKLNYFKERVFMSQLRKSTFYRVYKEVLSDHYPIVINCSNK